jgi:hypothetical protein
LIGLLFAMCFANIAPQMNEDKSDFWGFLIILTGKGMPRRRCAFRAGEGRI